MVAYNSHSQWSLQAMLSGCPSCIQWYSNTLNSKPAVGFSVASSCSALGSEMT